MEQFHHIFQERMYESSKLFQILKSFKNKCVLGEGRRAALYNFHHGPPCSLLFPKAHEQRSTIYTESGFIPDIRTAYTLDSLSPLGLLQALTMYCRCTLGLKRSHWHFGLGRFF